MSRVSLIGRVRASRATKASAGESLPLPCWRNPQLAAFSDCDLYDAAVPALAGVETIVVSHAVREVGFHRGMARFYRRFDAPGHNPLVNAAVFLGIGAKLVTSLAITALRGRGGASLRCGNG